MQLLERILVGGPYAGKCDRWDCPLSSSSIPAIAAGWVRGGLYLLFSCGAIYQHRSSYDYGVRQDYVFVEDSTEILLTADWKPLSEFE